MTMQNKIDDLRQAAKCVYLKVDKEVADDISDKLLRAASIIEELEEEVKNLKNKKNNV